MRPPNARDGASPALTMYEFDPSRLDLAREFKTKPFGAHSPDLQYLLNLMRSREIAGRYVLIMTQPHAQWTLARLTGGPLLPSDRPRAQPRSRAAGATLSPRD